MNATSNVLPRGLLMRQLLLAAVLLGGIGLARRREGATGRL
jgi:hypothetical protein